MSEPIISVSGLRGIVGTELTPAVVVNYISAFCCSIPKGAVVIGRDGRATGEMLADAAIATLLGHGMNVIDTDVASTPTIGVLVKHMNAVGGIQVSASHNPPAYNGLKLFHPTGRILPGADGEKVLAAYRDRKSNWVDATAIGHQIYVSDPHAAHLASVLNTINIEAIRKKRFHVLLDSNHGSGAILGRRLLEALGCDVEIIGESSDGQFEHTPEPTVANLVSVSERAKEGGFHITFCQDPDADRLAVIDEKGCYIGEEFSSVLCMLNRLKQNPGPIVTNCSSSSMAKLLAKQFDVPYSHSKVGEANVVDKMIESDAVYGGEGSGGPIDPQVGFIRDSFVGMAQILDLMARESKPISQIVDSLPRLVMVKDKVTLDASVLPSAMKKIEERFSKQKDVPQILKIDGLRLDWNDRWILLRGSNTEPIVRLIAEAKTESAANALIAETKSIVES